MFRGKKSINKRNGGNANDHDTTYLGKYRVWKLEKPEKMCAKKPVNVCKVLSCMFGIYLHVIFPFKPLVLL